MHYEPKNLLLTVINDTIVMTSAFNNQHDVTLTRPGMPILCNLSLEMPKDEDLHDQRAERFIKSEPEMLEITLTFKYPSHAIHILS